MILFYFLFFDGLSYSSSRATGAKGACREPTSPQYDFIILVFRMIILVPHEHAWEGRNLFVSRSPMVRFGQNSVEMNPTRSPGPF